MNLIVPGSRPGRLAWLKIVSNTSQGALKDTFSVYGQSSRMCPSRLTSVYKVFSEKTTMTRNKDAK